MERRKFFKAGTVYFGSTVGASVALSLGGQCFIAANAHAATMRTERWVSPSSVTPLQCYVVVAKEKGYFEAEGLDITIQATPGTAAAITQLASGKALFAQSAAITSVPAIANQNAEIITVGQVIYRSVFELASPANKPIKAGDSLSGKTIGMMSVGGSTDLLLSAMAMASKTDPASIKRVVTGLSAGAYTFLQRGQVDAFFSFYPMRIALEAQGTSLHYFNSDDVGAIPPDSIIVSKDALSSEDGRKAVIGYLRACAKGMKFLLDPANYDAATAMLAKYNPIEAADKALARKKFEFIATLARRPEGVPFMHCDDKAWQQGVALMEKVGLIKPNAKPLSAYYTNDLVKQI
jgi:NitT/TauT family transport system substrate-binding protein